MSNPTALFPRRLRIVIPGGSGHIGHVLARFFQEQGHHVTVLTRGPYTANWQTVHWDGEHAGPWVETLEGADVCINLAGRSVNCRYRDENRRAIYNSRIVTTTLLNQVIANLEEPPRLWLNASTATIYRHAIDRPMDEFTGEFGGGEMISKFRRAPRTWNFSIGVARDWEAAFFAKSTPRTRKVALRSAIVMSPVPRTAFAIFSNLVRMSLGGRQGNGRQFVSWVHETDFARAVEFLIRREDIEGPVNIAAPNPLPNRDFMRELRDAWGIPNGLPAPRPVLAIAAMLMQTETELVLKSRRVVPNRLLQAGFQFQFPAWSQAAEDLVDKWKARE
jgi:uncharacterized protein (TIGR01777 family)